MSLSITSALSQQLANSTGQSTKNTESPEAQTLNTLLEETGTKDKKKAVDISLSPQAQTYLQQLTGQSRATGFTLSETQEIVLDEILAQYEDVPLNEENYASLLEDLATHRLDPEALTMQDKINSFDTTQSFLDALSGKQVDIKAMAASYTTVDEDQAEEYLSDVVTRWQELYDAWEAENPEAAAQAEEA